MRWFNQPTDPIEGIAGCVALIGGFVVALVVIWSILRHF